MSNISKKFRDKEFRCYFELTLDVIGGKWKPVILYYLGQHSILRYGEIKKCMPKITERMLSRQLKELQEDGLINRKSYNQVPPKVEYSLTKIGKKVIPILNLLQGWGNDYYIEKNDRLNILINEINPLEPSND